MICVVFRFLHDDNSHPEFYGLAVAESLKDLFFKIDEHGDPYSCEIMKVSNVSICLKLSEEFFDMDSVDHDDPYSEWEISDSLWDGFQSNKFKKPNWKNIHDYYSN